MKLPLKSSTSDYSRIKELGPTRGQSQRFSKRAFSFKNVVIEDDDKKKGNSTQQALVDVGTGIVSSFLQFVFALSYAAGCFSSDRTYQLFGVGVMMTTIAAIFTQMTYSWRSEIPYLFVSPDAFYIPLIKTLGERLADQIADQATFEHTFLFAMVLCTVTVGLFKLLCGMFGAVQFTDYIPYPAICGLMAGIGVNLIQVAVILSTRNDTKYYSHIIPGLLFAIVSIAANMMKFSASKTFLILLFTSIILFYSIVSYLHLDMKYLQENNWTFTTNGANMNHLWFYFLDERPFLFTSVDFKAISNCYSQLFSIAILMVIKISLTIPAYEKALRIRVNKPWELMQYGMGTIVAGVLGGTGTSPSISILTIVSEMGGSGRLPGIIAPIILFIIYCTHFSCVTFAPKFIFAGLLFSSGYHMVMTWLIMPLYRIPTYESLILVVIILIYLFNGMLVAMGVGSFLSVLLFAYKFHQAGCVKFVSTGQFFRSTANRPDADVRILRSVCHRIRFIHLQGYIAFANANELYDVMAQIFESVEDTSRPVLSTPSTNIFGVSAGADDEEEDNSPFYGYLTGGGGDIPTGPLSRASSQRIAIDVRERFEEKRETSTLLPATKNSNGTSTSTIGNTKNASNRNMKSSGGGQSRVASSLLSPIDEDESTDVESARSPHPNINTSLVTVDHSPYAVIIEMNDVVGCDASAMDVFSQIVTMCRVNKCRVVFSSIAANEHNLLTRAGVLTQQHVFVCKDTDDSLTQMEDALLMHQKREIQESSSALGSKFSSVGYNTMKSKEIIIKNEKNLSFSNTENRSSMTNNSETGFLLCLNELSLRHPEFDVSVFQSLSSVASRLEFSPGQCIDISQRHNKNTRKSLPPGSWVGRGAGAVSKNADSTDSEQSELCNIAEKDSPLVTCGFFFVEKGIVHLTYADSTSDQMHTGAGSAYQRNSQETQISKTNKNVNLDQDNKSDPNCMNSSCIRLGNTSRSCDLADLELSNETVKSYKGAKYGPGWMFADTSTSDGIYTAETDCTLYHVSKQSIMVAERDYHPGILCHFYKLQGLLFAYELHHAQDRLTSLLNVMHFRSSRTIDNME